jgi:hypothetical protein
MRITDFYKKAFASIAVIFLTASAFAGFWDWSTPYRGPHKDLITLVITANYKKPLLLAQLIQHENRQPYILLPARKATGIFFCPVNDKKPALEIREKNLSRFIKFLNPKKIIILGDSAYVPKKYLKMIDKNIPIIIVSSDDWNRAAATLANLLDLTNLTSDYKRLSKKLDNGKLYQPTAKPKKAEVVVEEEINITETVEPKKQDAAIEKPAAEKANTPAIKEPEIVMPAKAPQIIEDKK